MQTTNQNPWIDRIGGAFALLALLTICHIAVNGWIDQSHDDNVRIAEQAQTDKE